MFYSSPGQPAFPVRLASEIFQRCWALRPKQEPCVMYDPCCGGAYHLSVLGHLHGAQIEEIVASDVDTAVLDLAQRNLGLLTQAGLDQRKTALQHLYATYQKPSHAKALASARRLQMHLPEQAIPSWIFTADVMDEAAIWSGLNGRSVDIVFSDIPYGWLSAWHQETMHKNPVWHMLQALRPVLAPDAIVAIAADKSQKIVHEAYRRLEKFRVGKRQVWLGRPLPNTAS